jgi:hypothetical protein
MFSDVLALPRPITRFCEYLGFLEVPGPASRRPEQIVKSDKVSYVDVSQTPFAAWCDFLRCSHLSTLHS